MLLAIQAHSSFTRAQEVEMAFDYPASLSLIVGVLAKFPCSFIIFIFSNIFDPHLTGLWHFPSRAVVCFPEVVHASGVNVC